MPTLREAGYRKEEGDSWFGILAPTGTSPAVIAKLDKAIGDAVRSPDIIEKLHLGGMRVAYLNAPDFRSRITDRDGRMFGNIIQKGNIKPDSVALRSGYDGLNGKRDRVRATFCSEISRSH